MDDADLQQAVQQDPQREPRVDAAHAPDELEPEFRAQAAGQFRGRGATWESARPGVIADELIAVAAASEMRPDQRVMIVIGNSSHATHSVVGSVAVSLARHSPVPLVIVR